MGGMSAQHGPPEGDRADVVRQLRDLSERSTRYAERAGAAHGLHRSDLTALSVLARAHEDGRAPLTPGVLARALALSPSATTTLLDRLERSGHVERSHDEVDRRRVSLAMTRSAGEAASAMFGPMAASMDAAMDQFDDDELAVVRRFLAAMIDVIDAQEPRAQDP
ncbi:hypothetical protein ASF05_08270 [Aeromicrobium sp. Leaf245]|nr:hypothetical protein ASF05_08270 [Aeromicrobium sp. Leaf245]KQP84299.1 hypothetical protein ASF35_05085 [Aeromicrobium sp. Leaf291]